MYFNLPKSNERQNILNKKSSSDNMISTDSPDSPESPDSTSPLDNTNNGTHSMMAEDRISEIIHNLDDHWGSPPIFTPDTLAHILNHQWINIAAQDNEEIKKKVSSAMSKANKSRSSNTYTSTANIVDKKVISNLIKEFCKTIQAIDTENKFEVTNDLKNDPIIQKYLIEEGEQQQQKEESTEVAESSNNVLEHLVELLQYHNNNNNKVVILE